MSDTERTYEVPGRTAWEHEHLDDPPDHAGAHEHVSAPLRSRAEVLAIHLLSAFDAARLTPAAFLAWDNERQAFLAALNWNPAEPEPPIPDNPHAMRWS